MRDPSPDRRLLVRSVNWMWIGCLLVGLMSSPRPNAQPQYDREWDVRLCQLREPEVDAQADAVFSPTYVFKIENDRPTGLTRITTTATWDTTVQRGLDEWRLHGWQFGTNGSVRFYWSRLKGWEYQEVSVGRERIRIRR
jgi:hypothetical protein